MSLLKSFFVGHRAQWFVIIAVLGFIGVLAILFGNGQNPKLANTVAIIGSAIFIGGGWLGLHLKMKAQRKQRAIDYGKKKMKLKSVKAEPFKQPNFIQRLREAWTWVHTFVALALGSVLGGFVFGLITSLLGLIVGLGCGIAAGAVAIIKSKRGIEPGEKNEYEAAAR